MKHKIFQVDGNNDSEGEDPEETNIVPLVLDDYGGITGPKLSQSSLPLILKDVRYQRFFLIFIESAHWADSIIESRCPSVCLCVCLSLFMRFFSRPLIGPQIT